MNFNKLQLTAMAKVGKLMLMADGKVDQEEISVISVGLAEFGISGSELNSILELSDTMQPETMLSILSSLSTEQKKFVCGFLSTIMISDGDIDDSELKLWQLTSTLAGFPTMSIREAAEYWRTH